MASHGQKFHEADRSGVYRGRRFAVHPIIAGLANGRTATLEYQQTTTLNFEKISGDEPAVMADSVHRTAYLVHVASGWKIKGVQKVTGLNSSLLDPLH